MNEIAKIFNAADPAVILEWHGKRYANHGLPLLSHEYERILRDTRHH